MDPEWIGWLSSASLLATVAAQVRKQILENTSVGVSKWLYIGQLAAEIGFVAYSWLLENWVFLVTNALLLVANVIGLVVVIRHRRGDGIARRVSPA